MKGIKHKQASSHTSHSTASTVHKKVVIETAAEVKSWPDWKKIGTNTTRVDNQWQKRTSENEK